MAAPHTNEGFVENAQARLLSIVSTSETEQIQTNGKLYEIGSGSTLDSTEYVQSLLGSQVLIRAVDNEGNPMRKPMDARADQLRWRNMRPDVVACEIRQRRQDQKDGWQGLAAPVVGTLIVASESSIVVKPVSSHLAGMMTFQDGVEAGIQFLHPVVSEEPVDK